MEELSLRVRRPNRRRRVPMLLAYGVRRDGSRPLLGFVGSPGESQQARERLWRNGETAPSVYLHRRLDNSRGIYQVDPDRPL